MRRASSGGRAWRVGVGLGALALAYGPSALAQSGAACGDDAGVPLDYGSIRDVFPTPMATTVPLDGFVRLRYVQHVPSGAYVRVNLDTADGPVVEGVAVQVGADEVQWRPSPPGALLRANQRYAVHFVADLLGATDQVITFTTGTLSSVPGPLPFEGALQGASSFSRSGSADTCGDPQAILVTLGWHRAGDNNWPDTDLEYVMYQTAGPNLTGVTERARVRGRSTAVTSCAGGADQCWTLRLPSSLAGGRVCFNVQALDPRGSNDGNTSEVCVDPQVGNYFNGCDVRAVGSGRTRTRGVLGALVVVLAALGLAWRVRGGGGPGR